jgi:predicted 2-oxoglutarate/Fe(II)-dependent dioxygenase YbiX
MNNYYKRPRMIYEPKWKSYVAETKKPIFTPEQCNHIINCGRSQPRQLGKTGNDISEKNNNDTKKERISHISWIPFNKLEPMYRKLEEVISSVNLNHFGFDGVQLTENAQYTEYSEGQFYNWHMDSSIEMTKEPTVRKISMTCLLSPENEFEGGDLELVTPGKKANLTQGNAIFFASFINHRVTPVTRGNRKSLVVWFGGPPLK